MSVHLRVVSPEAASYDTAMLALDLQRSLSACADLGAFLAALSTSLPQLLPARDRVSLAFIEPDGEWMRVYRVLPAFESPPARLPRVRVEGTVVGHVVRDGRARIVADTRTDSNITFGLASHDGIRSTASVPVTIAGRVVGVMNIGSRSVGAVHEGMLRELLAVAAVVGPAVYAAERVFLAPAVDSIRVGEEAAGPAFIGASAATRTLIREARRAAASELPILITGETGVGKSALATAIHGWSPQRSGPFVPVQVAESSASSDHRELVGPSVDGRSPGCLERAVRGTLLLDEIGDATPALQAQLVHWLQAGRFERLGRTSDSCRLIASTRRDLHDAAERGPFRLDLLHRLDVVSLHIAPLRERLEDLDPLTESILARLSAKDGRALRLTDDAWTQVRAYTWPGNVRELENVLLRASLLEDSDELLLPELRRRSAGRPTLLSAPLVAADWPTRDENERRYIQRVVDVTGGILEGKRGAAKRLGMNPSTLRSRMKRLGMSDGVSKTGEG